MKNKGFTLVELLAVIVILAVIGIITIPMIGNVIKDSKKKALETSVYGLVEAANYFAISNEGRYGFLFNENKKGETTNGQYVLDYKGEIDAKGELYIDSNGDISLCLENEDYYVYKNYNSGIYVGNISEDSCELKFDPLTNKYIAYLASEGEGINVYTKEEVNNLIDSVNTNVTNNTNEITSIKENITNLQTDISNYATKSDVDSLSSVASSNQNDIGDLQNSISDINNNLSLSTFNTIVSGGTNATELEYTATKRCEIIITFRVPEGVTNASIKLNERWIGSIAYAWGSGNQTPFLVPFSVTLNKGDVLTFTNSSSTKVTVYLAVVRS